ncbi:MAG TPA: thiamine pyrophosphate-dependent enzyme [Vicinamibacterales bacterium]|nr:thiamine pyrophosphate-dependent enzyme [Vicinamibacterales bacterium]
MEKSSVPLLIAGLGARQDAAAIRQFCERLNVPAMVTYKAKGVVPDGHRCFAGVFTNGAIEREIVDKSDLIIGVGLDPVELLPRPWTIRQPIIGIGAWRMADDHVPFADQWVTDISSALAQMEAEMKPSAWDLEAVARTVGEQRRRVDIPAPGLTPLRVVRVAAQAMAATSRVTVDAGAHMFPATVGWPVTEPNGMLISNGLSTMGFALPAAIGAALADPARPVVAVTGDGGLLMCAGELLTAARERARVMTIVLNDASLSLIEIKQQARKLPGAGVALGAVSWARLAESFGVAGFEAATDDELARAIERASACAGPSLIDVRVDRSGYREMLKVIRG